MTNLTIHYPNDRVDGYVILTCNGMPFIPRFTREDNKATSFLNFKSYYNAWRILLKRFYGKDFEPNALSNYRCEYPVDGV